MYKYALNGPVDYFDGCVGLRDFLKDAPAELELSSLVAEMADLLRCGCWEGDVTEEGIFAFALPPGDMGCEMQHGFIWKQKNNGTTFVLSPHPLQWIEQDLLSESSGYTVVRVGSPATSISVWGPRATIILEKLRKLSEKGDL